MAVRLVAVVPVVSKRLARYVKRDCNAVRILFFYEFKKDIEKAKNGVCVDSLAVT